MEKLGARFTWKEKHGCPPFVLEAQGLAGGNVDVDVSESSQYLSGLLLAAPMAAGTLVLTVAGNKVVSWPYVALTLQVLTDCSIAFVVETRESGTWSRADWRDIKEARPGQVRFIVSPGAYKARNRRVEGDWSNASYFLAAGAIGPNPVTVAGLRPDSLQGDRFMLDILERMGANVAWNGNDVTVSPGELAGIDVDMGACPDIVPTVAVTAALGQGVTEIRNVAHLRIKESDRLSAVAAELGRIGARVEVLEDGLRIDPGLPARRARGRGHPVHHVWRPPHRHVPLPAGAGR